MTVTLLSLLVLLEGGGVNAADETCSLLQAHVPNVHVGPYPIPCTIHQTAKTHYLEGSDAKWADTWRQKNPDCAYKLWNDTEIAELARTKSPDVVWPIWEGLSGVERADVFRYLVLWVHGGYYADVDVECLKPIATYQVPKDVSMLVGFEYGHRHQEFQRVAIKYARTEQFQQWFIASAPKSPVLERVLHMIRQRFSWKITSTLDLTGPGVFSDAVHEFLASSTSDALENEILIRQNRPEAHFLSFKSEEEYGGDFKVWVFAAGRVNAAPQVAQDDPNEGKEPLIEHHFEGSWKEDKDWELKDLKKRHQNIALFAW
ncbi:6-mannosyltransferase [Durusdinium trenchii]|uniref:6-mannosyltransferase n=1 Tax=Durusdinium trenchii TaxID=1381693 RepID=A0ABP0RA27_9DINO